jgi:hypothetical protein
MWAVARECGQQSEFGQQSGRLCERGVLQQHPSHRQMSGTLQMCMLCLVAAAAVVVVAVVVAVVVVAAVARFCQITHFARTLLSHTHAGPPQDHTSLQSVHGCTRCPARCALGGGRAPSPSLRRHASWYAASKVAGSAGSRCGANGEGRASMRGGEDAGPSFMSVNPSFMSVNAGCRRCRPVVHISQCVCVCVLGTLWG